jgi:hypothetical protein
VIGIEAGSTTGMGIILPAVTAGGAGVEGDISSRRQHQVSWLMSGGQRALLRITTEET